MGLQLLARATAIGVLLGIAVAAETARLTTGLLESPGSLIRLTALAVIPCTVAVVAIATILGGMVGLLRRLGLAAQGLVSARFLWGATLLYALHVAINESKRSVDAIETFKGPLRLALGIGALLLLGSALLRAREGGRLRAPEWMLALGIVPALVLAALLHVQAGRPADAPPTADVATLAPRFVPEPLGSLRPLDARNRPRIVILGLDGASWDLIDRGVAEGRLPTFERLIRGGRRAALRSFTPTHSPVIWTSMMTGVPGSLHGIELFYLFQLPRLGIGDLRLRRSFDPVEEFLDATGELRRVPVTSSLRRRKAIWNLADEAGLRAAVVGLWATWPAEPLQHGWVVSDHASLARRYEWLTRRKTSELTPGVTTHPADLEGALQGLQRSPASVTREELEQFAAVDDALWAEFEQAENFSKAVPLSAFRSSHLNDAFFLAAGERLWRERRPDLTVVYAKAIDELSHFFYEAGVPEAESLGWSPEEISRYAGVVARAYAWTDRRIAPLVEAIDRDPNALLIVASDHGWEKEPDGSYDHNFGPPGILILYGHDLCRGDCPPLGEPTVFDIAPTVLERLGLPASEEMPGAPIPAFRTPHHDVRRVASYGERLGRARALPSEIDAELNEKLRALGYAD